MYRSKRHWRSSFRLAEDSMSPERRRLLREGSSRLMTESNSLGGIDFARAVGRPTEELVSAAINQSSSRVKAKSSVSSVKWLAAVAHHEITVSLKSEVRRNIGAVQRTLAFVDARSADIDSEAELGCICSTECGCGSRRSSKSSARSHLRKKLCFDL